LQPISANRPATADKASAQEQLNAAVSEETRTHARLKLLSKEKLLTQVLRGLEADLALKSQLTSPVDGTVQQLAVHSVGGVVTSAQPLMIIVPDSTQVTAEVSIANQDIGFVNQGQTAEVKLETFSFTKYGTVQATVDSVTADAVTDDKKGSYYPATLTLSQKDMLIDGKRIPLSPGMSVTAEIKTGKRRIVEFLLSPVQRAGSESLRER
jgi:hemolysin D